MNNLVILPTFSVSRLANGKILLTKKFLNGILEYKKHWNGSIVILSESALSGGAELDYLEMEERDLPFKLEIVNFDCMNLEKFSGNSIFLCAAHYRQNRVSKICKLAGIPSIYILECSLNTRKQIVKANTKNIFLRLRRILWEVLQERKQINACRLANGLQCNGIPVYDIYRRMNPNTMLYFDNRTSTQLAANDQDIEKRLQSRQGPLRLLFSGRLIKMKGADHLVRVGMELKKLGVDFKMYIYGDGELKDSIASQIKLFKMESFIELKGVADFSKELAPFVRENIDLFVCCHRQGDPSCTYLETMALGVPIIGYDNEAFAGLADYSKTGWLTKIDRPEEMALKIAALSKDPEVLKKMSYQSLEFARRHFFEETFQLRMEHVHKTLKKFNERELGER